SYYFSIFFFSSYIYTMNYKRKITGVQQSSPNKNNANQMRNIAIQQKGQVQEVQVAVKDAVQEAQEARVNCEEANVSQKLLHKDVKKKVKQKVQMKKKKFCSLLPNKKPYKAKPSQVKGQSIGYLPDWSLFVR